MYTVSRHAVLCAGERAGGKAPGLEEGREGGRQEVEEAKRRRPRDAHEGPRPRTEGQSLK